MACTGRCEFRNKNNINDDDDDDDDNDNEDDDDNNNSNNNINNNNNSIIISILWVGDCSGLSLDARLDPHVERVDRTCSGGHTGRVWVFGPPNLRETGPQQRHVDGTLFGYGQCDVRPGQRRRRSRRRRSQRVRIGRRRNGQQRRGRSFVVLGRRHRLSAVRVSASASGCLIAGDRFRDAPRLQLHLVRRRLPVRKLLRLMQLLQMLFLLLTGGVRLVRRRPLRTGTPDAVPTRDLRARGKRLVIVSRGEMFRSRYITPWRRAQGRLPVPGFEMRNHESGHKRRRDEHVRLLDGLTSPLRRNYSWFRHSTAPRVKREPSSLTC